MPFTLVVEHGGKTSDLHDFPDRERAQAEGLIAEFRAGVKPMDDTLTVHHAYGVLRIPWADVCGMRIEES
jgi:hypothetical protein